MITIVQRQPEYIIKSGPNGNRLVVSQEQNTYILKQATNVPFHTIWGQIVGDILNQTDLIDYIATHGGGSPGGDDLNVQWNNNGVFAGDERFIFDPATGQVSAKSGLNLNNGSDDTVNYLLFKDGKNVPQALHHGGEAKIRWNQSNGLFEASISDYNESWHPFGNGIATSQTINVLQMGDGAGSLLDSFISEDPLNGLIYSLAQIIGRGSFTDFIIKGHDNEDGVFPATDLYLQGGDSPGLYSGDLDSGSVFIDAGAYTGSGTPGKVVIAKNNANSVEVWEDIMLTNSSTGVVIGNNQTDSGLQTVMYGRNNTQGSTSYRNTVVGIENILDSTGFTKICFGYNNINAGDSTITIGNSVQTHNGNSIGVGANLTFDFVSATTFGHDIYNNVADSLMIGVSDSAKITILSNGNSGFGTTAPSEKVGVVGKIYVRDGNGCVIVGDNGVVSNTDDVLFGINNVDNSTLGGGQNIIIGIGNTVNLFGTGTNDHLIIIGHNNDFGESEENSTIIGQNNNIHSARSVHIGRNMDSLYDDIIVFGLNDNGKVTITDAGFLGLGLLGEKPLYMLDVVGQINQVFTQDGSNGEHIGYISISNLNGTINGNTVITAGEINSNAAVMDQGLYTIDSFVGRFKAAIVGLGSWFTTGLTHQAIGADYSSNVTNFSGDAASNFNLISAVYNQPTLGIGGTYSGSIKKLSALYDGDVQIDNDYKLYLGGSFISRVLDYGLNYIFYDTGISRTHHVGDFFEDGNLFVNEIFDAGNVNNIEMNDGGGNLNITTPNTLQYEVGSWVTYGNDNTFVYSTTNASEIHEIAEFKMRTSNATFSNDFGPILLWSAIEDYTGSDISFELGSLGFKTFLNSGDVYGIFGITTIKNGTIKTKRFEIDEFKGRTEIYGGLGVATVLGGYQTVLLNSGAQAGEIDYTLPSAYPSANGQLLAGTTAGVLSWANPFLEASGAFTRATSDSSGNYTVSGLTFRPKLVYFTASLDSSSAGGSDGWADGSKQSVTFHYSGPSINTYLTDAIWVQGPSGDGWQGTFSSMNSDGFTISFTALGSKGNIHVNWYAIG